MELLAIRVGSTNILEFESRVNRSEPRDRRRMQEDLDKVYEDRHGRLDLHVCASVRAWSFSDLGFCVSRFSGFDVQLVSGAEWSGPLGRPPIEAARIEDLQT